MKFTFFSLILAAASSAIFPAAAQAGCPITSRDWHIQSRVIDLDSLPPGGINRLRTLYRRQLNLAANHATIENYFTGAYDAAQYLISQSEGRALFLYEALIGSEKYTVLRWYPQGREYAWIFVHDSLLLAGMIQDGQSVCFPLPEDPILGDWEPRHGLLSP